MFEGTIDNFAAYDRKADLPRAPLQAAEWIEYLDAAGVLQTLGPGTGMFDAPSHEIGRIALAWNRFWPFTRYKTNAVTIRFAAGYRDAAGDVPQAIRRGILIEISNLHENREDAVVGQNVSMLSLSERLLGPYRALSV